MEIDLVHDRCNAKGDGEFQQRKIHAELEPMVPEIEHDKQKSGSAADTGKPEEWDPDNIPLLLDKGKYQSHIDYLGND
jgi:hypothetical protein